MPVKDDKRKFDALAKGIRSLQALQITVGVHGEGDSGLHRADGAPGQTLHPRDDDGGTASITMPQLAAIHEFGTDTIPERSFIRAGITGGMAQLQQAVDHAIEGVMAGKPNAARNGAELIGMVGVGVIQDTIARGIDPQLAPSTKAARDRKGKTEKNGIAAGTYTPLRDTGQLIQSLTYKVSRAGAAPAQGAP